MVRQESAGSTDGGTQTEESTAAKQMEDIFQKLMKLTGKCTMKLNVAYYYQCSTSIIIAYLYVT